MLSFSVHKPFYNGTPYCILRIPVFPQQSKLHYNACFCISVFFTGVVLPVFVIALASAGNMRNT